MSQILKRGWTRLGLVLVALALVAPVKPADAQEEDSGALPQPKLIGVYFHADWCRDCAEIDLIIEDISHRFDGEPILGVIMDLTNQTSKSRSRYLAAALGLDKVWNANAGKTATIYLLDGQTKEILVDLSKKRDFEEISKEVEKWLSR